MFKRFKKKTVTPEMVQPETKSLQVDQPTQDSSQNSPQHHSQHPTGEVSMSGTGMFARLKSGLSRTRERFASGLGHLILSAKTIDADLLEQIETILLTADVGIEATEAVISEIRKKLSRQSLKDSQALLSELKSSLQAMLQPCERTMDVDVKCPYVILIVGVNGAGKTTTIGKLANHLQYQGKKVMLAAGDTFRAAAIDQLKHWGEQHEIPVIAQKPGSDSAAVAFDALQAAQARDIDILIVDTAGRLHTQSHLLEELKKVKRVLGKLDETAPHEVLLVLDASIGQNALVQAEQFHTAVDVSGLVLTKLDGTAKGGVIFAIAQKFGLPIRFIGVGERAEDLRSFNAASFVDALFEE